MSLENPQSIQEVGVEEDAYQTDEQVFQAYVEELRLAPEDFEKSILDVGSGSAKFAKWAKEHGVSSHIVSLEIRPGVLLEKTKGVVGDAEKLPFADGSFDMVVSSYAVPHADIYDEENVGLVREMVDVRFSEMLRVLKAEGEIKLVGVPMGGAADFRPNLKVVIKEELERLSKIPGIVVELARVGSMYRYEQDGITRTDEVLCEKYLVIIRKSVVKPSAISV